jgi:transketolase
MFGKVIAELLKNRGDLVFLVADSGRACGFDGALVNSGQFIDCGIAEQNMTSIAAGLARCGKRPIMCAFAPFAAERCFEQIRVDVAYSNLNVIIVGCEGGVGLGTQGVTHFGWEDIALMRSLPNMKILCPADNVELIKCLDAALTDEGPVYIRLNGGIPEPIYDKDYDFTLGKGIVHCRGTDASIVVSGPLLYLALQASEILKCKGISCGVVDMHTIKPIDEELIAELGRTTPIILSVEEHTVINGLGSAIADVLSVKGCGGRLVKLGLPDKYPATVSTFKTMLSDYGFTTENIVSVVEEALQSENIIGIRTVLS